MAHVLHDVDVSDRLSKLSGHDREGNSGQTMGRSSTRRHEEVELIKVHNWTIEGPKRQDQACPECIETQGLVDCPGRNSVGIGSSLKPIKKLGQASNETNQSVSEQITSLQTTVEGLKVAAENSKQDSAKLIDLQQQVGKIRTTMDEFSDSLTCHFQNHSEKLSALMSLIDKQSLKSQANVEKLNLLSAQFATQTKRAGTTEEWNARQHEKSLSHREKQAEQDNDRYKKIDEAVAAERYPKASETSSALLDRVEKLDTKTLNMHQHDVLLSRLLRLEIQGASKNEVNELRNSMLQLDEGTAKTSQVEKLVQRSDNLAERVNLIESGQPSASIIEQARKQTGVIGDMTSRASKMEHLQKTEAQIRTETPNSYKILDLTLQTDLPAKQLSVHHEDITSLQQEVKLSCEVLQGLKDMLEQSAKGVPGPFLRLRHIFKGSKERSMAHASRGRFTVHLLVILLCIFQLRQPIGKLVLMKFFLEA